MITFYHIEDQDGNVIYKDLPSLEQAQEVLMQLGVSGYRVVSEKRSTVKPGFGRDPDLH